MKEEAFNIPTDSYFLSDCISPDETLEDNNFLSPEAKPENIFEDHLKDASEAQLSSKILGFPFILDSYQLIYLKNKDDPELNGEQCKFILGNLEKIRYNEPILKLIFFSKDRKSPLNLNDFPNEINALKINLDIEFISICQNKIYIQCENENSTNEAYTSLQKSSALFDLLYDEEGSINSLEDQNKGNNSHLNSAKKNNNQHSSNEGVLSSNKKEKKFCLFNKFDVPIININNTNENDSNKNYKEDNYYKKEEKNLFNSINNNSNKDNNINEQKDINSSQLNIKQISNTNQKIPLHFPPPILLPFNNLPKVKPEINPLNPSLMWQIPKINQFLLQAVLSMQNLIKIQQLNQKNNPKKLCPNEINLNNSNGKNDKVKIDKEYDNYISTSNKESSTNSKTSSSSSKETSPSSNNQFKNNVNSNINFNIPNINFELFNGFNSNEINNNQNNNTNNFVNANKNIHNNNYNSNKKKEENNEGNYNLEQIVLNKKYKEYIPKNLKEREKEKLKGNKVEFHTNSTRDYQFKYVSRYIVQIENEKDFPVTKMIIGNNGKLLRQILLYNCINFGDHTTKIRLRGKGSGYKEGPKNEESKDPMELCISSLNMISYIKCSQAIENLLLHVYYQYYLYQYNSFLKEQQNKNNNDNKDIKDKNGCPVVMKKILKYQYVVNRFNTLVKEEKRRKEEELKNANQNISYKINKGCNNE